MLASVTRACYSRRPLGPGLRERRVSRTTGTTVSIYDADELDAQQLARWRGQAPKHRWIVCCEDHCTVGSVPTLAEARALLSSCGWCYDCRLTMFGAELPCDACGRPVVWCTEDDITLCDVYDVHDTALLDDDCDMCAPLAIHDRCQNCARGPEAITPQGPVPVPVLTTRSELPALSAAGPIEVIDLVQAPVQPGSWAAVLRAGLQHRRGRN
jgi:hypothetical protein